METYAGIDLHSSNNYIGILDANDKRLYSKRYENRLEIVLKALAPFKKTLKGVVVESTYKWDSFWLAHLLRLGILSQGYIYPKEQRPVRDLLRRRLMFVKQRTAQILSLQSMISRILGLDFSGNSIKGFDIGFIEKLFDSNHRFTAEKNLSTIHFLSSIT